ncbi:NADPH oxidoreductase [Kitasatospora paracochleata]|uniref:Ferredoxin-NADP reductase n=1 Tax=Kitasatospora paracochleata TaxID=58354 RepID=A0ABT1IZW7_9ACTN|nr:ferredoxin reductase [Kitasatospora paracochleata]MCP2310712.1 ferredoxin-NADP reductase [Kitasatospora paracochleata]
MTSAALRSRAWKLLEMVTTPLLPSDYLDLVSPLRAGADLRGRIEAVHPETGDAATVVIRPGRGWRGHTAGQYLRIGVDVDGRRLWRAYSITSPTGRPDGRITITVKAVPDGKVSNHLVHRATPGTLIQLDQPAGDFVLPQAKPAKVLYLTAGSGITPVMGMLRDSEVDDAVMVHCAPQPQDVIFRNELHGLVADKKLRLTEVHTATAGRLDIARLGELVPDWAERETWACGPAGLLDAAEEHWTEHGVQERLHTERFRPRTVVAGDGGAVTFSATGRTVDADGATPLLDIGEEAGVLMPSGCRMGICFGCVTPLKAGAVRDLRTGEITEAEPGVLIQTCVSAAAGPCDIER